MTKINNNQAKDLFNIQNTEMPINNDTHKKQNYRMLELIISI